MLISKLADKIYTDSNLLPVGEVIRNLPDGGPLTEILTEISGKSGKTSLILSKLAQSKKSLRTA